MQSSFPVQHGRSVRKHLIRSRCLLSILFPMSDPTVPKGKAMTLQEAAIVGYPASFRL